MNVFVYSACYFLGSLCKHLQLCMRRGPYDVSIITATENYTCAFVPSVRRSVNIGRDTDLFVGVAVISRFRCVRRRQNSKPGVYFFIGAEI